MIGSHDNSAMDVCWSSNIGLCEDIVASGGLDNAVRIWHRFDASQGWSQKAVIPLDDPIHSVSFNQAGEQF